MFANEPKNKLLEGAQAARRINANHSAVNNAVDKLRDKHKRMSDEDFERDLLPMFEAEYKCKILMDDYGIHGVVHFKHEKSKTHFLLKYGS